MNNVRVYVWYYSTQLIRFFRLRLEYISEANKDIAQVLFATFVIGSFTPEPINWNQLVWGLIMSMLFWGFGIMSYRVKYHVYS
jgi:hypothetical protein